MRRITPGFTLVELLIASLILTAVLIGVYGSFQAGMFGFRSISESASLQQEVTRAFNRIELDLRNSFAYSQEDTYFYGTPNSLSFVCLSSKYDKSQVYPVFSFIKYSFSKSTLSRLARNDKDSLNKDSLTKPEELAGNLSSFSFTYGYKSTPEGPLKFDKAVWNDKKKIPQAVRVTMSIKDKVVKEFSRTIYIPLS